MADRFTRRDLIQGVAASAALSSLPLRQAWADGAPYPPALTGLRGSHPGSFEPMHALAMTGQADWGEVHWDDRTDYDLVVVGAGLSGLSAAWFFREERPDAAVLVLDNHDDFGGHARRVEFTVDGRPLITYGGSQSIDTPRGYSRTARRLLRDLGIDLSAFKTAYDEDFYRRHGLSMGVYFDARTYGENRLLRTDFYRGWKTYLPLQESGVSLEQAIPRMPISEAGKAAFLRLVQLREDQMPGGLIADARQLSTMSYLHYLTEVLGVTAPEVIGFYQRLPADLYGYGIDKARASELLVSGFPGIHGSSLGRLDGLADREIDHYPPYIYHFPCGNAGIARLLVARLIPGVGDGADMHSVVLSRFDYGALDAPGSRVRVRLNSLAVRVEERDGWVEVTSLRGGRAEGVRARRCVLACYNMAIPHLCPGLPEPQKQALRSLVKLPLVYSQVAVRHWRPWAEAGVGLVHCPGSYHENASIDMPVSLGGYACTGGPDEPTVIHLVRVPSHPGLPLKDQLRAGRWELLGTPFEVFERELRAHLDGMLGPYGFEGERDIAGITVNRWPHGYAYSFDSVEDEEYARGQAPNEIGRQPFGRISIANSDAGGDAYADVAMDQAHRAVREVLG